MTYATSAANDGPKTQFFCSQAPADSEQPYGGRCGAKLAPGELCDRPHEIRPIPFSMRTGNGIHYHRR
jgi:hypothetical protein